jgi:hypothetical protein
MDSFIVIAFGVLVGLILVFSVDRMLWATLLLSMVIFGLAIMITTSAGTLRWAITMVSVVMFIVVIGRILLGLTQRVGRLPKSLLFFYVFIILTIIGAGLNFHPQEWISAAKNYFQFWAVPLVYYYLLQNEMMPRKIAIAMLILASLQPLVSTLQYVLIRGSAFIGDRIGGTFGSGIGEIGGNAELAMFQVTQMFVVFALVKYKSIRFGTGVALSLWFLVPLYFTATKAVIVMIPLGMIVLYLKEMRARPVVFTGVMIVALSFSAILTYAYFSSVKNYYSVSAYAPDTFEDFVQDSIAYNVEDRGERELNRTTSLVYWLDHHSITSNPLATLFGHGLGAAKMSGQVFGRLYYTSEHRGKSLGVTLLARLLWEAGLLGALLYTFIFVALFVLAGRLAKEVSIPVLHRAFLSGYQASLVVLIISIPYKKSLVNSQSFAAYSMFLVGYILFWYRYQRQMKFRAMTENVVT